MTSCTQNQMVGIMGMEPDLGWPGMKNYHFLSLPLPSLLSSFSAPLCFIASLFQDASHQSEKKRKEKKNILVKAYCLADLSYMPTPGVKVEGLLPEKGWGKRKVLVMENSSHDLRTISCSMSQMIVTSPIEDAILSSMLQECFYPKGSQRWGPCLI